MNDSRIASRYARACYSLAVSQGKTETVKADLGYLAGLLDQSPEFRMLLESPVLRGTEKIRVMTNLFKGNLEDISLHFLVMLVEHKREIFLASINRMFVKFFKADQGVLEAQVESAQEMDADLLVLLKKRLEESTRSRIELKSYLNDDLIGGFKLTLEDQQIDASVSTQLKTIKNELRESKN
jgi:F-type H+-transporting ATPase subunit delta